MLKGICKEAAELLADKPCTVNMFGVLKRMKPLRQIEAAELMIGQKTYSLNFAKAIWEATPAALRVPDRTKKNANEDSVAIMKKMESELAAQQMLIKSIEDSYGPDVLHFTVLKNYLTKLLQNEEVVRWMKKNSPEYLGEFQKIAELTKLPT